MKHALLLPADAPALSPCVNICQVDTERGWCTGCLRTLEEIALWSQSSDDEKRAVLARLASRRQSLHGPDSR
jgi:predicted Fe-S protein YdhL (DUF1289 family)